MLIVRVMGVSRFEDLVAWQLAVEAKRKAYALIDRTPAKDDFKFRDQLRDAAASAPAAIAQGFGRYRHPEFAHLLGVAKASLNETKNHILDGVDRKHWTMADSAEILDLVDRSTGAVTKLLRYVRSTDAPGFSVRHRQRHSQSGSE